MTDLPTRIDFLSGHVEIIEAIAFSRNRSAFITKQPHVVLRVKETILTIEDKNIMWSFLDMLDTNEKFPFLNYLKIVDSIPLKRVIEDFLHDYPNTMFHVWVDKGVIVGFDGKEHNPMATSDTMHEINTYIKSKDENYDFNICLREYKSRKMRKGRQAWKVTALTAEYIHGNKIIEIVSEGRIMQTVYFSARYSSGSDFIQPIQAHVYKGQLFSMPVKELYTIIDLFLDALKVMDENPMPEIDTQSQAHRLTIEGRNRLERERGQQFFP